MSAGGPMRSQVRGRVLLWLVAPLLYAAFWFWYTPLGGPLTAAEIEAFMARLDRDGADPLQLEQVRRFMETDTGRQFLMVNVMDMAGDPPTLPDTGPGASAEDLLGHYMAHMYPALFRRACHPVFLGEAAAGALDLVGIEGARAWTHGALVRYRSRRDMMEIATDPVFRSRHEYKLAALAKTIAFPVEPRLYLSDLRLWLAVILAALAGMLDLLTRRTAGAR